MTEKKKKVGRPRKAPRVIMGKEYWRCPSPPHRKPRKAHWVPGDKMVKVAGRVHTYCKDCNNEIVTHARDTKGEAA